MPVARKVRGAHPHALRRIDDAWTLDLADETWVQHCADLARDTYAAAIGHPCIDFRFGDRFTSLALASHIERRGVRCDVTLEPGLPPKPMGVPGEHRTAEPPDTRHMPRVPYHHDHGDLLATDARRTGGMWSIPAALRLWYPTDAFRRRLDAEYARTQQPHLAMVIRSDMAAHGAWERIL